MMNLRIHGLGGTKKEVNIIPVIGNIEIGYYKSYTYSQNGNVVEEKQEEKRPDFNIDEKIVIIKNGYYTSDFNDNYVDEEWYEIVIYIPAGYEHDPEIKEILEKILNM